MSDPSTLVTTARLEAGLSRRALAGRVGVPTSTICRIEYGEMDPTFTMLERVLAGAGMCLHASCETLPDRPSLARLVDAYDSDGAGTKVDWARLRGFIDWLELHADRIEDALETPPPRTGTVIDALLAAIAEKVSADHQLSAPRWARTVPPVEETWTPPGTPRMIRAAEEHTPEPFRRRRVIVAEHDLWRSGG